MSGRWRLARWSYIYIYKKRERPGIIVETKLNGSQQYVLAAN